MLTAHYKIVKLSKVKRPLHNTTHGVCKFHLVTQMGIEAQETSASSLATALALNNKSLFISGLGVFLLSAAMEL